MPLDGTVVSNIAYELKNKLFGCRIDKIYQPEKDEIILSIKSVKEVYKLSLTSNPSYPKIHITEDKKENPQLAPMFCMLLRKHLINGRIMDIIQPNFERIIEIHILSIDQIGDKSIKRLIIEIMGKHSNIILVDENNKVLDSIKHITNAISSVREVYPGTDYFVPKSNKINPLEVSKESFNKIFENTHQTNEISNTLINNFIGFGKILANEIEYRFFVNNKLNIVNIELLWDVFYEFIQKIKDNKFIPALYFEENNNIPNDFSSINLLQLTNYSSQSFESISQVIEKFYVQKDTQNRMSQKTESLRKSVTLLLDRDRRKLANHEQKTLECADRDKYKIWGELILSNIYAISAGSKQFEAVNYYTPNQDLITIKLDENLSPSENAQKYFKKYNKLKRTENSSLHLIDELNTEIDYLGSVLYNIENCILEDDINQIKTELSNEGLIKKSSNNKKKSNIKSKPMSFKSSDGFKILVGKNNIQNDELTLKIASKSDIWLHTKKIHGTHVIIRNENNEVPDTTLFEAATLAAYYSKAKNSSNVEIDYTTVKNVKKSSGAKPGMVIYVNYKTIVVNPDSELIEKLKA